jgi:hypothetical protein
VITIRGDVDPRIRANVERCLGVAASALQIDNLSLRVTDSRAELPDRLIAGATKDEILVRPSVLADDGVSAAATLLEEAAHVKLAQLGVIDGLNSFVGALVQEFFATWFAWHELLKVDATLSERFEDGPMQTGRPTPEVGYALGAFLGAAHAGVPRAVQRVEAWFGGTVDPETREWASRLMHTARSSGSTIDLVARLAAMAAGAEPHGQHPPSVPEPSRFEH